MTQYIDKDKVIEYVKQRLISIVTNGNIDDWERGANNECINFLSFINSLPEESASENLEEAATKWDETASFQPFYMQLDCKGNPCEVKQDIITHKESFKAGAEWQKERDFPAKDITDSTIYWCGYMDCKEEMMKDAVEGVIDIRKWPAKAQVEFYDRLPVFNVRTGDKVKIIIVKEEQQ